MPVPRFDSTVPVEPQLTIFSCSVGATFWCLRSLGMSLTQQDLENVMVPSLVSPDVGLLDGSGATIACLLRDRYALSASNASPVTFDQVTARAGKQPIAIGGARWFVDADGTVTGHWVAVRGFDGTQLILANPGGTGPHFGQQVLDPAAFAQRAPFAAVWIDATGAAASGSMFRVTNTDGQGANLRSDPTMTATVLRSLPDGVTVTGGDYAWRAVTAADGQQGWIANEFLAAVDGKFRVANTGGAGANLRPQPSATAPSMKLLAEGTELTGEQHAWRQVTDSSATSGWVAEDFLAAGG